MSKRHTMGVSKWLPSTKDKITFKITLRPSTPDISKHLLLQIFESSNCVDSRILHCLWYIYIRLCSFHFFRHHFTNFTFMGLADWCYGMILDCDLSKTQWIRKLKWHKCIVHWGKWLKHVIRDKPDFATKQLMLGFKILVWNKEFRGTSFKFSWALCHPGSAHIRLASGRTSFTRWGLYNWWHLCCLWLTWKRFFSF